MPRIKVQTKNKSAASFVNKRIEKSAARFHSVDLQKFPANENERKNRMSYYWASSPTLPL